MPDSGDDSWLGEVKLNYTVLLAGDVTGLELVNWTFQCCVHFFHRRCHFQLEPTILHI
jgi:hypothetical protein